MGLFNKSLSGFINICIGCLKNALSILGIKNLPKRVAAKVPQVIAEIVCKKEILRKMSWQSSDLFMKTTQNLSVCLFIYYHSNHDLSQ